MGLGLGPEPCLSSAHFLWPSRGFRPLNPLPSLSQPLSKNYEPALGQARLRELSWLLPWEMPKWQPPMTEGKAQQLAWCQPSPVHSAERPSGED